MRPELEELNSRLDAMSREDLILSIRRLMEENSEKEAILEINSSAVTEMSIQFQQVKDENAALKKENRELLRLNRDLTDQLQMRKKDLYGRKSEKSSGLADAVHDGDPADPIELTTNEPGCENPEEPGEDRVLIVKQNFHYKSIPRAGPFRAEKGAAPGRAPQDMRKKNSRQTQKGSRQPSHQDVLQP